MMILSPFGIEKHGAAGIRGDPAAVSFTDNIPREIPLFKTETVKPEAKDGVKAGRTRSRPARGTPFFRDLP